MNIAKFFTREELVSGIEISDDAVRLVVLEKYKEKLIEKVRVKLAVEESLPKGAVTGGLIKDKTALDNAIGTLLKKSQTKIKYAILSIPMDLVYSKIFSFPKNIQGERLEESMKLTIGFQLPVKMTDVYLDWESIKSSGKNEIVLAAAPKGVINEYVDIFKNNGAMVIAVEINASSIGRAMEARAKDAILIRNNTPSSTQIFIMRKGVPYFIRVLPKNIVTEEKVEEEIRKSSDFFESGEGFFPEEVNLSDVKIVYDLYSNPIIKENNGKWLASVGAAMRGLMPRAEDTLISLMPVGTEQAYEYNKALSFSSFVMNTTVSLAVFFIIMFSGSWAFTLSVNQRSLEQVKNFALSPISPSAINLESKAKELNEEIAIASGIVKKIPDWSGVVDEIKLRVSAGIIINNFTVSSPEGLINLAGVAKTRSDLNVFKKSIEGSAMFVNFNIPLSNIGQKENIPFTVSMSLKDTRTVYKNAL